MKSPWQLIGYIILMASMASAFEIRYIGDLPSYPVTIFELQYKKLEEVYKSFLPISQLVPTIALPAVKNDGVNSISNIYANITNRQRASNLSKINPSKKGIISQALIATLKQIEKKAQYSMKQIVQTEANLHQSLIAHTRCFEILCFVQQRLIDITKLNTDVSFLLPGQLIQLKDPSDFVKGIQLFESKEFTQNKLTVKIRFNGRRSTTLTIDPTEYNSNNKIMNSLVDHIEFLNSQPIKLYVQWSDSNRLGIVLKRLGLSTKVYEMLRLATNYPARKKQNKKLKQEDNSLKVDRIDGKVVIILHQSLFSAALDLNNPTSRKNDVFFNLIFETYSERMLQQISERQAADQSGPLVVTQANFGRLLIFTLQKNMETLGMMEKLGDCFTNDKLHNNLGFSEIMSVIARQRPQYYHAGVTRNQNLTKRSIDWQDIFFPITTASISQLQPISARAASLSGHPYMQIQRRYYTQYDCQKNKIELVIFSLGEFDVIEGIIDPIRPEDKHPFNITHPGTFQISSLVGSEPFELNLVARSTAKLRRLTNNGASYGIKFFFMKKKPVYSIQAEFALLVNGEERLRHAIGNSRSDRQYHGVRIRIDPNHLVDMKILEDF